MSFLTCSNDHFNRKAVLILNFGMETKEKGGVPNRKPFLAAQLEVSFPVLFVKVHRQGYGKRGNRAFQLPVPIHHAEKSFVLPTQILLSAFASLNARFALLRGKTIKCRR